MLPVSHLTQPGGKSKLDETTARSTGRRHRAYLQLVWIDVDHGLLPINQKTEEIEALMAEARTSAALEINKQL